MTDMKVQISSGGNPPKAFHALIKHEFIDGCHVFTSDSIRGLLLVSKDANKVLKQLVPSIKELIRKNHGVDCTVDLTDDFNEFAKKHCTSGVGDKLVIRDKMAFIRMEAAVAA